MRTIKGPVLPPSNQIGCGATSDAAALIRLFSGDPQHASAARNRSGYHVPDAQNFPARGRFADERRPARDISENGQDARINILERLTNTNTGFTELDTFGRTRLARLLVLEFCFL